MITLPNAQTQLFDTVVFNAQVPKEGPKGAGVRIPFTATEQLFEVNLLLTQSQQFMSMVQALYVDNYDNGENVVITSDVINQRLVFPGGAQGYVPILVPKNAKLTFFSDVSEDVATQVIFLNVPVPAIIWYP